MSNVIYSCFGQIRNDNTQCPVDWGRPPFNCKIERFFSERDGVRSRPFISPLICMARRRPSQMYGERFRLRNGCVTVT